MVAVTASWQCGPNGNGRPDWLKGPLLEEETVEALTELSRQIERARSFAEDLRERANDLDRCASHWEAISALQPLERVPASGPR